MTIPAAAVIGRHELRVLRRDPGTIIFVLLMPLLLAALMQPMYQAALITDGPQHGNGADLAVPGMAVSFAAFGASYVGFAFLRDHGWNTWDRLRATPASTTQIITGKVAPAVALTAAQMMTLLLIAGPVFGFHVTGSWAGLTLIVLALAICLNALAVTVVAFTRTSQQFNAISGLIGLVLATLGGAFVPTTLMPDWAQTIAPVLPTHWAIQAMNDTVLHRAGLPDITGPLTALTTTAAALAVLAALRLHRQDSKTYWG
jgi:ABC-2 type transport system permease protein